MIGIVWYDSNEDIPFEKLKKITKVFNEIKFDKIFLSFLEFFRQYNFVPTGKIFKLVIPQNKLINGIRDWNVSKKETFISSETKVFGKLLKRFNSSFSSKE